MFYDANLPVLLTSESVCIMKDDEAIKIGERMSNGLWSIGLSSPPTHPTAQPQTSTPHTFSAYDTNSKKELVMFLQKAVFSHVPSTWIRAIDADFFTTWPGLTSTLVRNHLPKSIIIA